LAIKTGGVAYEEVAAEFEAIRAEAQAAAERSSLPETADMRGIERLYHSIMARAAMRDSRLKEYAGYL